MTAVKADSQNLTTYSRFVLYMLVLPLLFIAGVQLFIFSEKTETYFAWTFASALSAAFLGAGYWAAMFHAYSGARANNWAELRVSMPAAIVATTILSITTFIHLDKFHLAGPLLMTRFVTWVWIAVYIFVPPVLAIAWFTQSRMPGANARGQNPLPAWVRSGFMLLSVFGLLCGLALFLVPETVAPYWPWTVTPLAARAVSAWLTAFGVACVSLAFENDIKHGAGACASLFAFCILQFVVLARYASAVDWAKPLTIVYILFLLIGLLVNGASLLAKRNLR